MWIILGDEYMLKKPLSFVQELLKDSVMENDIVIDATVGNGNDTLLLATLVGPTGKVYGFDVQEEAIQTTKTKLLLTGLLPQTELILDGHENLDQYVLENPNISAITFNLGYLPKSDKSIITTADTTLKAIEKSLIRLRKGGLITIMVYYGHEGGLEEKTGVANFVANLPQEEYQVLKYEFVNQKNNPPFLFVIEKK